MGSSRARSALRELEHQVDELSVLRTAEILSSASLEAADLAAQYRKENRLAFNWERRASAAAGELRKTLASLETPM